MDRDQIWSHTLTVSYPVFTPPPVLYQRPSATVFGYVRFLVSFGKLFHTFAQHKMAIGAFQTMHMENNFVLVSGVTRG